MNEKQPLDKEKQILGIEIEQILEFLSKIRELTPECKADLRVAIKRQEVRKDEVILKIGEINDRLYFIRQGAMYCSYYVGEDEVTSWIFSIFQFVCSISSFYERKASKDCIVVMEDGVLLYIMRDAYENLCAAHHCFSEIARLQLQRYLVEFENHPRFIRRHKADERIRIVRGQLGDFYYRIPRNILASWLDMDPATFSRNQ
ncbi:MAG TPA: hypothetical protein VGS79_28280 [Puia sp.]|nr:hypothetical protein [Puia sp.]